MATAVRQETLSRTCGRLQVVIILLISIVLFILLLLKKKYGLFKEIVRNFGQRASFPREPE